MARPGTRPGSPPVPPLSVAFGRSLPESHRLPRRPSAEAYSGSGSPPVLNSWRIVASSIGTVSASASVAAAAPRPASRRRRSALCARRAAAALARGLVLAHEDPRGARHAPVQPVAPHHLAHHHVVVLGVVDRLGADGLAGVGVEGRAQHGDALEPLLLQRLKQLRPDEDQALDERVARVGLLGGLERPVQVVENVDELDEQPLAALIEAAARRSWRVKRSR